MTQAIQTKYLGPTNSRGSRIKATCYSGSITIGYDHGLDTEGNHEAAVQALILKLGWHQTARVAKYVGGQLADGSCVFVQQEVAS